MATTGRLTADQRTAIKAGAVIVQKWFLTRPKNSAHTLSNTIQIGQSSGITSEGVGSSYWPVPVELSGRIVKAGSRKHEVWNPSPNVSNTPQMVRYTFIVANSDSAFFASGASNVFYYFDLGLPPVNYQAQPHECTVTHKIYVVLTDGSESEITHMAFTGRITSVRYEDIADPDGNPIPGTATITCEQGGAWEELRRVWTVDDGTHAPMTGAGALGMDIVWTVT